MSGCCNRDAIPLGGHLWEIIAGQLNEGRKGSASNLLSPNHQTTPELETLTMLFPHLCNRFRTLPFSLPVAWFPAGLFPRRVPTWMCGSVWRRRSESGVPRSSAVAPIQLAGGWGVVGCSALSRAVRPSVRCTHRSAASLDGGCGKGIKGSGKGGRIISGEKRGYCPPTAAPAASEPSLTPTDGALLLRSFVTRASAM